MKLIQWPVSKLVQLKAPYHFTFGEMPENLNCSIKAIGVTHPPKILQSKNRSDVSLISGQRRIHILYQLNKRASVPVFSYSFKELSDLEAFHLNLFENLSTRQLNPIEKSNILKILHQKFKVPFTKILSDYLPLLNLPLKSETVGNYLSLQKFNLSIKKLISKDLIQTDNAIKLLNFAQKDRMALAHLIQKLNLGINNQKNLLVLAWEIYRREKILFSKLVSLEPYKSILQHHLWTPSQKWAKLEIELKKRRFPKLSQFEAQFNKIKKELKLPPSITLHHPPYFETNEYILQMRFKNLIEYQLLLTPLNSLHLNKSFKELFQLTLEDE